MRTPNKLPPEKLRRVAVHTRNNRLMAEHALHVPQWPRAICNELSLGQNPVHETIANQTQI